MSSCWCNGWARLVKPLTIVFILGSGESPGALQVDGFSSYEVDGLLDLAKTAASQRQSQELLERTYSQAKRLIDEEDFGSAVNFSSTLFAK